MPINFWEAQRRARLRTAWMLIVFVLMTIGVAFLIEWFVRQLSPETTDSPPMLGVIFFIGTCLIAGFYYLLYKSQGGQYVAKIMGGKQVLPTTMDLREQQLLNVVEEVAVASHQPVPPVFVIEAKEINAFAAGINSKNAAITVTRGTLEYLNRDELQGVIAHEFSHIANGDMKINMRLAAMVMGFMVIFYLGIRLLQSSFLFGRRERNGGGNPVALMAMVFLVAGAVTWFAGTILRSMVSRQREYLADASAVQYTRNPSGIANALKKIASQQQHNVRDMPKAGMAYKHLYFNNFSFWASLFATHPPIEKRIAILEGRSK